jgi:hypothetical protein
LDKEEFEKSKRALVGGKRSKTTELNEAVISNLSKRDESRNEEIWEKERFIISPFLLLVCLGKLTFLLFIWQLQLKSEKCLFQIGICKLSRKCTL